MVAVGGPSFSLHLLSKKVFYKQLVLKYIFSHRQGNFMYPE